MAKRVDLVRDVEAARKLLDEANALANQLEELAQDYEDPRLARPWGVLATAWERWARRLTLYLVAKGE